MDPTGTTSNDRSRRRAARCATGLILVALALVGLLQIRFGETYPPHGLGAGDSRFYAWMAVDFSNSVLSGRLDSYRVQRALPSALVHVGLRALDLPRDTEYQAVLPFQILNLGLLAGTALVWHGIANATGLSAAGRWFGAMLLFLNFACLKSFFYVPVLTDASAFFLGGLMIYGYLRSRPWLIWTSLLAGAFTWPAFLIPGCPLLLWPRAPLLGGAAGRRVWPAAAVVGVGYLVAVAIALRYPVVWITEAAPLGLVELNRRWLPLSLALALALLVLAFANLLDRAALFRLSTHLAPLGTRRVAALGVTWLAIQCIVRWYASPAASPNPLHAFLRYLVLQPVLRPAQAPVAHVVFFGLLPLFLFLRWRAVCRATHELGLGMTLFLASLVLLALGSETRQLLHGMVALVLVATLAVEELRFPRWAPWALSALAVFGSKIWFELNHGGFTAKSPAASYPAQYWFMNVGPWMADEMYVLQGSIAFASLLVVLLAIRGSRTLSVEEQRAVWPSARTVARIALAPAAALVACAAVEWPARVLLERATLRARQDPVSVPDSLLGWRNLPGRSVRLRSNEYDVSFDVNRLGLRGPEPRLPKPPGVTRVLILGGSLPEGYSVSDAASVRARLEARLRDAGCREAEVHNAAVARYSTEQQALLLSSLRDSLRPDAVVVFFNHEDLIETLRTAAGADDDDADEPPRAAQLPAWLRQPRQVVHRWRNSASLRLLSNLTAAHSPGFHRALGRWGVVEYGPPPLEFWPLGLRDENNVAWQKAAETLARMKAEVSSSGGSLALFDAPSRYEVDRDEWRRVLERYRMSERFWRQDRVARRVRALSESLGVTLVDPRPALKQAQESSSPAYWKEAGTWNERGHQLSATALTPVLAAALGCGAR